MALSLKAFKIIANMTDRNAHGEAREYIAKNCGFKRLYEVFKHINAIHEIEGSTNYNLLKYRDELTEEMLRIIRAQEGEEMMKKLYQVI